MTAASRMTPFRPVRGSARSLHPRVWLCLPVVLFAWAAIAGAQTVDSTLWVTDGPVSAIVRDGNTIYIGGSFTRVGPATGSGVPLGATSGLPLHPFPRVLGSVYAVVPDGSGGWFIGGDFSAVGGSERLNLAHVLADGSLAAWAPNPNGPVQCLALEGSRLYVGGGFRWIGARWRDYLAAIDVTTGIATSWNPGADGPVRALAAGGGIVYPGGDFLTIAGQSRRYIAAIDAATGVATAWNPDANGGVHALALRGNILYAGGQFMSVGWQTRWRVAAIDLSSGVARAWNPSANGAVLALAVVDGRVYAGGEFTNIGGQARRHIAALDTLNGGAAAWNPDPSSRVNALSVAGPLVFVGGEFSSVGGELRKNIAALDATTGAATSWNPGANGPVSALAAGEGVVYAGGAFNSLGGVPRNNIAALDAASGTPTPWNPNASHSVSSIAVSGGLVYAGGAFSMIGGVSRGRLAALQATTGAPTAWNPNANDHVKALVVSGNTVYAGGSFRAIGGQARSFLAAVDATTGAPTSWNPSPDNVIHALALRGTTLYVAGQFNNVGGQPRSRIAALDAATGNATAWNPDANTIVEALAPTDSVVYAGGHFTSIGGHTRSRLAALDIVTGAATPWNPGSNGPVYGLAASAGMVYVGGSLGTIGGQSRGNIAAVDAATGAATHWNPGASGYVSTLTVSDNAVYAGGGFWSVGDQPQPYVAAISRDVPAPASVPIFTSNVAISASTVAVGEAVTITATVRNDGAASDDGRIVFSFKDLTDPLDAQRVSSASTGDAPGFRLYPRGTTLLGRDCRPVTASYLVAEYADSAWAGLGGETDTFRVTVRPRAAGVFSIDVRSTMRVAGEGPCAYASAMPPGGITTLSDQQGWTVRRFVVYVDPTPAQPQPQFSNLSLSSGAIVLGQSVTISTMAWNAGALGDGRIVVSFPSLTDPLDSLRVASASSGDRPGFRVWPAGSALSDTACRPTTASYLVAEYADSLWEPIGHEVNPFAITVQPREVGTFTVDVRATMRTAFGPSCEYVNGVPSNGQAGFSDQQGWPVKRFTVIVLAPPTIVDPAFTDPITISADSIILGQNVRITASAWNLGTASDDGRIVLSFPALTDPLDGPRVSGGASGDGPGFRVLPAGSPLLGSACQTVTASYLVAEYVDDNWLWVGTETNTLTATVTPRAVGDFVVDVRSTMHTAGGAACAYQSDVPPNGQDGYTDQQGWPVRRFVVHVKPPPSAVEPVFASAVTISSGVIQLGQDVRITASVRNLGAASDDGRIVISFPALTDSTDRHNNSGSTPEFHSLPAGSALLGSTCQTVTASYLVAEYADNDWQWLGTETHTVYLAIQPRALGTFAIDIRTTMHTPGAGSCAYVSALPPNGVGGYVDQQGWDVMRFTVAVVPVPPAPVFMSPVGISAGTIDLGEAVTITARVRNDGAVSDDGRVVFSFPALIDPGDGQRVSGPTAGDAPGYRTFAAGSPLVGSDCQPMTASYLTAEYADSEWLGNGTESNACTLTVRPRRSGTFTIEVRSSMHAVGGGACAFVNQVPSGVGGYDQQGWAVSRFNVTVLAAPATALPTFVGDVFVSTDVIGYGGTLTISATVLNTGAQSDDGRIVLSFPGFDQPGDAQYVSSSSSGDAPGFRMFAPGSTLLGRTCQPVTARHLTAEYADARWDSIGDETNTFTVTIRPPREGLFAIEVRSTMRTAGAGSCAYVNGLPANGEGGFTDQQGWEVKRFEVLVGSPPSMTWSPIAPGVPGPSVRALQAAVYDATRDEMSLYGGTALTYTGDSWTLPLAPGASWSPLQPGGPVPLRRIMHSMVHDPVHGSMMIFGGLYDDVMDDLWVLARSPVAWWFAIAPPGARPSPRMGHEGVYDPVRQRMLVIGGYGRGLLNDVWEYAPMVNGTWRQLAPSGPPMPPRATFSAIYDPVRDRVVIFGGDGGPVLNDVWELTLGDSLAWRLIVPAGAPPGPRREHTAVYDARWDEMVVFGGFNVTRRLSDVWTLSLSGTPRWERRFASSQSPSPRSGHSAVYDPVRQRMVMFGGQLSANTYSNEVWALTLDRATPVALSLAETEVTFDHVRLAWFGEGAASLAASVERSVGGEEWFTLGAPSVEGPDRLEFTDRDVVARTRYGYRLRVWQEGAEEVLGPVWVTVPVRAVLSLAGALPNPVSGAFAVAFSLPGEGAGALELFDLRGRLVARRELTGMGAGEHRVVLAEGKRLAAGIYWVRLTHADRRLTAKACVVR